MFCEAPNDCYERNGETYRGAVSRTENGEECLDWRSYFILEHGENPFTTYSDFDGLEENHCRYNPIVFTVCIGYMLFISF